LPIATSRGSGARPQFGAGKDPVGLDIGGGLPDHVGDLLLRLDPAGRHVDRAEQHVLLQ
jgi:hypothetical protein